MNKRKTVDYDLRIYAAAAINTAVLAYRDIASIGITMPVPEIMRLSFPITPDTDEIIGEFNNYLIQIENRLGAQ